MSQKPTTFCCKYQPIFPGLKHLIPLTLVAVVGGGGLFDRTSCGEDPAPSAVGKDLRCEWIEGTLIPQVVIGVRRLGDAVEYDEAVDFLDVFSSPTGGKRIGRAKLFQPFYVSTGGNGSERVRIQEDYYAKPLGWVDRERLEFLESRYAYVFAEQVELGNAELHDLSKEAYERHLAQLKASDDAKTGETVVLRQRPGAASWLPVTRDDPVPFIERLEQSKETARNEPDYPDTTPTFRYRFPSENRLLHMGAICGGPVDAEELKTLQEKVEEQAGIEMLFLIDETSSMEPYFKGVADFFRGVGNVAIGEQEVPEKNVRAGVVFYSDGPLQKEKEWFRWSEALGRNKKGLQVIEKRGAQKLANEIQDNEDKLPLNDFADAPEKSLEALDLALRQTAFTPGASKYVAVIGDTGYEEKKGGPNKAKLISDVARKIAGQDLTVFFVHVGPRKTDAQDLFRQDAEAVKLALPIEVRDRINYITAEQSTLAQKLKNASEEAESLRRRRERDIMRMEARNQATEPGPKLMGRLRPQGMTLEQYESSYLQYFVPVRGWLFNPLDTAAEAVPQFEEVVFLSPVERKAIIKSLDYCRKQLAKKEPVDASLAVNAFVDVLSQDAGVAQQDVLSLWEAIPEEQRDGGVFIEYLLGLRVKATFPFPPDGGDAAPETVNDGTAHKTRKFWQDLFRVEQFEGQLQRMRREDPEGKQFWYQSSELIP